MRRVAVLLFTVIPLVSPQFLNPSQRREVWRIGETKKVTYNTKLKNYTIALWQQAIAGGSAELGPILVDTTDGPEREFEWKVDLEMLDLGASNIFFFCAKLIDHEDFDNSDYILNIFVYFLVTDGTVYYRPTCSIYNRDRYIINSSRPLYSCGNRAGSDGQDKGRRRVGQQYCICHFSVDNSSFGDNNHLSQVNISEFNGPLYSGPSDDFLSLISDIDPRTDQIRIKHLANLGEVTVTYAFGDTTAAGTPFSVWLKSNSDNELLVLDDTGTGNVFFTSKLIDQLQSAGSAEPGGAEPRPILAYFFCKTPDNVGAPPVTPTMVLSGLLYMLLVDKWVHGSLFRDIQADYELQLRKAKGTSSEFWLLAEILKVVLQKLTWDSDSSGDESSITVGTCDIPATSGETGMLLSTEYESTLNEIRTYLEENARGVIFWVKLVLNQLELDISSPGGFTPRGHLMETLKSLPLDIEEYYRYFMDEILAHRDARDRMYTRRILFWVLGSNGRTRLELQHLREAIAIPDENEKDHQENVTLEDKFVIGGDWREFSHIVRYHCGPLVEIVDDSRQAFKSTNTQKSWTVQLSHHTVTTFLQVMSRGRIPSLNPKLARELEGQLVNMPFDFKAYDAKCNGLTPEELQREWEHYTRLIAGASTSTAVSGIAVPFTLGVSTIGVAMAAPAIHNARKKRDIIEKHLNKHGATHVTRKRDVLGSMAVSGTIGVVTLGVGTTGADAIATAGAEHGISAVVENETAIKVIAHAAMDGVGMGIEHAHTSRLKKKDAFKAFRKAGVFQAVKDAKAAEAGYSIQPYNPQTFASGSNTAQALPPPQPTYGSPMSPPPSYPASPGYAFPSGSKSPAYTTNAQVQNHATPGPPSQYQTPLPQYNSYSTPYYQTAVPAYVGNNQSHDPSSTAQLYSSNTPVHSLPIRTQELKAASRVLPMMSMIWGPWHNLSQHQLRPHFQLPHKNIACLKCLDKAIHRMFTIRHHTWLISRIGRPLGINSP
ncbi:hypothetical protein CkaCkLH20_09500 [Colletotrichum karsti]|uniref:Uncharacterized protein n=1 Tax=Colletotrichum karsti TaxID=1095194 RepID=A0A9P6HZG4_9PEZI|nr:uncharacterized protein CkaCkLH20_09500 [Colletotrichum karsti]KAF9872990.1 hypothetical protein CkaCkLH20_09500 [Colletotrichum karsti]